jgi:putative PIN family toxin of toxin-antitoxin system
MIRAVLDANVVVSALLNPVGPMASILNLAALRRFRCYVSGPILDEYGEVLGRAYLRLNERTTFRSMERLRRSAVLVEPRRQVQVCVDAEDNKFLECALEARADYVVTGNVRHFPARFQDIRVVLPRQFLTVLAAEPR